jgi:hypothetical protein
MKSFSGGSCGPRAGLGVSGMVEKGIGLGSVGTVFESYGGAGTCGR